MTQNTGNRTARRIVVTAALLYLLIAVAAIVAHVVVPATIQETAAIVQSVEEQEAEEYRGFATAVVEHSRLWLVGGAGGEFVVLLSEVVLSVLLFVLFASVDKTIAILAMVARLVMTTIHGANVIFYFAALHVARFATAATGGITDTVVGSLIELHGIGFTIGITFLVIHMFALGYVMLRSSFIPRWIAALFLLAGVGYLIDATGILFIHAYEVTPPPVAIAIALAELVFPVWLLVWGRRAV